ncbi:hypothetical protein TP37_13795 [Xanthomonas citri pv. aurantifolii]|nr:hypothetical protein TP37_13795 [Xanthomonas citri pv. aurantifolii]AMV05221.1 hypothetical protein TP50_18975 [Xanthomonas citri pv. aurantifolii]TBW96425.1 hypothetical protein TP49_12775 [Xanthomonas citri pv. aurantifolii]
MQLAGRLHLIRKCWLRLLLRRATLLLHALLQRNARLRCNGGTCCIWIGHPSHRLLHDLLLHCCLRLSIDNRASRWGNGQRGVIIIYAVISDAETQRIFHPQAVAHLKIILIDEPHRGDLVVQ